MVIKKTSVIAEDFLYFHFVYNLNKGQFQNIQLGYCWAMVFAGVRPPNSAVGF